MTHRPCRTHPCVWSDLSPRLLAWFYRRTKHRHDAEDLAADVAHRLLEHARRHGPPRCVTSVALRTARNLLSNYRRDRQRRRVVSSEDTTIEPCNRAGTSPETRSEFADALHALRPHLGQDARDILGLVLAGATSPREIASLRATSIRTAQLGLGRLREAMRDGNLFLVVRAMRPPVSPLATQVRNQS